MRSVVRAVSIIAFLTGWADAAVAEHRLAFVVGIDRYRNLPPYSQLERARNDAHGVGRALEGLGFEVTLLDGEAETRQDNVLDAFTKWSRTIHAGDTALFFFAGHGLGRDGGNYLLPSDMPDITDPDGLLLRAHALQEAEIRQTIQARGAAVTVLILDACRDDPFRTARRSGAPTRGLERNDTVQGAMTIYAAGYGESALDRLPGVDDTDANSVFSRVVIAELRDHPGIDVVDFSEDIRDKVASLARSAGYRQVPAIESQLIGGRSIRLSPLPPAAPVVAHLDPATHALGESGGGAAMRPGPSVAVMQRAALLVDAPDDPQKVRTYAGTVVWRLDNVSPGQGQPLVAAVEADIDIPDARLKVTMLMQRNDEPKLPASHTIEFHFLPQPGNNLGGVKQVNVPEMRRDDDAPTGDPLAGVPATIKDDHFLVGLSRGGAEGQNLRLVTERDWFDMSLLFVSGKLGKLTFEKGAAGQHIIEDALKAWH